MVETQDKDQAKSGYYKKSWKKWLLIYLIVGAVVYGGIYLVMAYGNNGTEDNKSTNLYSY